MSKDRLYNLRKDLSKAKQQALLIEVLQSDLDSWADQSFDAFRTVCDASVAVFDVGIKECKTNVLTVGETEGQGRSSIFGSLLDSLDNEFDELHKREILAKLAGFGLSQAFGGVVSDAVGGNLNVGAEKVMDYLADWTGSATEYLTCVFEACVEEAAEKSADLPGIIGEIGTEALAEQFPSTDELYLSPLARKRLKELAPRLRDEATSHETLQLALEMMLAIAQGTPKIIVIKDPLNLDDASLALLAMLVSLEKDLRQVNYLEHVENRGIQTTGISVVLTFTDVQPNENIDEKLMAEKQRCISRLRMMASRYSLLEQLDSDIPVPAVRASTFVGRHAELECLWQEWNRFCEHPDNSVKRAWCLIKGEPGTGKTALANRFIQKVRSDKCNRACLCIPTLRMLNQTGHSAQATGLASLKNSIVEELRRLNFVYEENVGWFARWGRQATEDAKKWVNDAKSDDPEAKKQTRGRIGRIISRLMGVDAAVEVVSSAKAWSQKAEMRSVREQEFGQSSQVNRKEEQYELLREALQELRKLALACHPKLKDNALEMRPFLLLIDDLQWIDDFTAEFLRNEWPDDVPVFIVATARGSDSFTIAGDSRVHQAINRHRDGLFTRLGLIDAESLCGEPRRVEEEGQQQRDISLVSALSLKGMDQFMLASLIELTYTGITAEQSEQLATGITQKLSGENGESTAITLFAIEALNVISDPQFYRRNPELPRLIEPLLGTNRYRFKKSEKIGLTEAVNEVFKKLTETYQASYQIELGNTPRGKRFKLASYAVMEERLHLIEQYFGEYGGTARYSLLFSALLGSPFQSGLIQHVIDELKKLAPQEFPKLTGVISELQRSSTGSLGPTDYELLERSYELIRRLEERSPTGDRYEHQHSLFQQFLLGQFTQLLHQVYTDPEALENGIQALVDRIEICGNHWFEIVGAEDGCAMRDDQALEMERLQFLVALSGYWYRHMITRTSKVGEWGQRYSWWLNNLAFTLHRSGRVEHALPLQKEALMIRRKGYELYPERWAVAYSQSLNNLAGTLAILGCSEEALSLEKEALSIQRWGYDALPTSWAELYAIGLSNVASSLVKLGDPEKALPLLEEARLIWSENDERFQDPWFGGYSVCLSNLASTLQELERTKEARPYYEKSLSLLRQKYETSPERWVEDYARSLNDLAVNLQRLGCDAEALPRHREALSLRRSGYQMSPERWAEDYANSLNNLAATLGDLGQIDEALPLEEEAVSVLRRLYEVSPERWQQDYAHALTNLALTLEKLNRRTEALSLYQDALAIRRLGYEKSRSCWVMDYAMSLNNLATAFAKSDRPDEALSLFSEALEIRRQGYEASPNRWKKVYAESLHRLAWTLEKLHRRTEALPLYQEALSIQREGFEVSPEFWAMDYTTSLSDLAAALKGLGHPQEALPLFDEALSIQRKEYESSPDRWAEDYAITLSNMAATFGDLRRFEEALQLQQEAMPILRQLHEVSPERSKQDYPNALTNLALTLEKLQRRTEALSFYKDALAIQRLGYEKSKKYWAKDYASTLKHLADTLEVLGYIQKALAVKMEALSVSRYAYQNDPEHWAKRYATDLSNLAVMLGKQGHSEKALLLYQTAIPIERERYEKFPSHWAENYAISLHNMAFTLQSLRRPEDALPFFEEALTIRRKQYERAPEQWSHDYTVALNNTGSALKDLNRLEEAVVLLQEALKTLRQRFQAFPERGSEGYVLVMNNLACVLEMLGRSEETRLLREESLLIQSQEG